MGYFEHYEQADSGEPRRNWAIDSTSQASVAIIHVPIDQPITCRE